MLTTKITKAIGGNSDLLTSQSFVFQGAVSESEQVMLIVLLSGTGEDVFTKVRNLGLLTEQHFFNNDQEENPPVTNQQLAAEENPELISLNEEPSSFKKIHKDMPLTERLRLTMELIQEQSKDVFQKSILLAVLKDEVLYMLSSGEDKVLLLRDEKSRSLIHQGDTQLISGYLQPGDKVLFLSPRLEMQGFNQTESFPEWDDYFIQRLLLSDQAVVEEEIGNYLQQLEIPEPIAVVLLSTQTQEHEVFYDEEQQEIVEPEYSASEPTPLSERRRQKRLGIPTFPKLPSFSIPRLPTRFRRSLFRLIFPLSFKKIGFLAVIVLAILVSGSIWVYQFQQKNIQKRELAQALDQTRNNLAQAEGSRESNLEAAKEYLATAEQSLQKAQSIEKENTQVQELNMQFEQAQKSILKTAEITDWQTFLSLDLIRPGFSAKRMSFSVKKLLLLDESQKSLSLVDIETKNNQLLAGQTQLGDAQVASLNGDYAFVFSQDKGLLRIETIRRQITTVAPLDKEWGRITDVFGFSSNVYLLDAGQNQIWKYVPTQSSYSEKQIYLKDNQGLEFADSKQLFIDFSVWVLKENAGLFRFTAGTKDFYSIGGLDEPLEQIERIYAPEEEDKVFLLDNKNKRLVLTKKNGEYISQYTSERFATATDLVYDEETKILYLLEGGKIYQTTLP